MRFVAGTRFAAAELRRALIGWTPSGWNQRIAIPG